MHPPPTPPPEVLCPYRVLGVRRDATHAEIRRAYRRLALLHHPSRRGTKDDAPLPSSSFSTTEQSQKNWKFIAIAASFETLWDDAARRRYDTLTREKGTSERNFWQTPNETVTPKSGMGCGDVVLRQIHRSESLPNVRVLASKCRKVWDNPVLWAGPVDSYEEELPKLSVDEDDEEMMKSTVEEEQKFGGPLHMMFKARNHAPFTDPFRLFNEVFNSDIFQTDETVHKDISPTSRRKRMISINQSPTSFSHLKSRLLRMSPSDRQQPSPQPQASPQPLQIKSHQRSKSAETVLFHPISPACAGTTTKTENGKTISKTSRIVGDTKITRTEITTVDPVTGKKSTRIEVKREENEDEEEEEEEEEIENRLINCCVYPDDSRDNDDPKDCNKCGPGGIDQCLLMFGFEKLQLQQSSKPKKKKRSSSAWSVVSPRKDKCEQLKQFLCSCGPFIP